MSLRISNKLSHSEFGMPVFTAGANQVNNILKPMSTFTLVVFLHIYFIRLQLICVEQGLHDVYVGRRPKKQVSIYMF